MFPTKGNRYRHDAALSKRKPIEFGFLDAKLCAFIPLPDNTYAIVDAEDLPLVQNELWQISRGYVARNLSQSNPNIPRKMHRLICNCASDVDVDHINGNRRDNRRSNLRIATRTQNNCNKHNLSRRNKSGKTGVSWDKKLKKWVVHITVNKKTMYVGVYAELNEAVEVRRQKELDCFGTFAPLEV
jgi:hypothetical protein